MYEISNEYPLIVNPELQNKTFKFYSTDSEEKFRKNSKKIQNYTYDSIEYKFNEWGHRSKNLNEVNDDFILTFGCSYSEGVGLRNSEIWPSLVSSYLKKDLYNIAKESTGIDFQYYNTVLWNKANLKLPSLVIVQWPYKHRKMFAYLEDQGELVLRDATYTNTYDGRWWEKRYVQELGEMKLNVQMWYECFNMIWKSKNVPVLNFSWDECLAEEVTSSSYRLYTMPVHRKTFARDLEHDGPDVHSYTADKIIKILSTSN